MKAFGPLPFNVSKIQDKAFKIVQDAKDGRRVCIAQYKKLIGEHLNTSNKMGLWILSHKRNHMNIPRLPSEIWNLVLMDFGGNETPLINAYTISKQISKDSDYKMDQIWYLYHKRISECDMDVEKAQNDCDKIMDFIYNKIYKQTI